MTGSSSSSGYTTAQNDLPRNLEEFYNMCYVQAKHRNLSGASAYLSVCLSVCVCLFLFVSVFFPSFFRRVRLCLSVSVSCTGFASAVQWGLAICRARRT